MSYDLPYKPVPKLMNSRDLVPIRDKLATGLQHQTLCECSQTISIEWKVFCAQCRMYPCTTVSHTLWDPSLQLSNKPSLQLSNKQAASK